MSLISFLPAGGVVRVALLSDTHNALDRRIAAVVEGCDVAIHAGDIGSPEVLLRLAPKSGQVFAVRGNNDTPAQWPAGTERWLHAVPEELSIALPGGILTAVHGHRVRPAAQRHHLLREKFAQSRAIVYGHTHRLVVDDAAQPWVLNPGAAGLTRTMGVPSCLVLHAKEDDWRIEQHIFKD